MVKSMRPPAPEAEARVGLTSTHPGRTLWPWQIAFDDWKIIVKRLIRDSSEDRLSLVAAALAFYATLALFPALIALVSLFGLIANPDLIEAGMTRLSDLMPPGARDLLQEQLHALVTTPRSSLSLGLLISVSAALWSASSGVDSLVDAINVAYDKVERRNFFRRRMMSLLMTLGLLLFTFFTIVAVALVPTFEAWLGERIIVLGLISALRWPTLACFVAFGLMCLYRYAPSRKRRPKTMDLTGPIVATVLFLVASSLFSLYVSEFASYHKTYGAVGSVVALLFWFYYSSFVMLLGAELSAELEGEKMRFAGEP
jgi:membrane protein